eukprot:2539104-Prymnesium_polylepis.2
MGSAKGPIASLARMGLKRLARGVADKVSEKVDTLNRDGFFDDLGLEVNGQRFSAADFMAWQAARKAKRAAESAERTEL